jgi:hypothetical protein
VNMTSLLVDRMVHKSVPILCWLFICLLLSQGIYTGLVVCFGANSHLGWEAEHPRNPSYPPSEVHQGPCQDLPLTPSSIGREERSFASGFHPTPQVQARRFTTLSLLYPTTLTHSLDSALFLPL